MKKICILLILFILIITGLNGTSLPVKLSKPDSLFIGTPFQIEVNLPARENMEIAPPKRINSEKVELLKSEFKIDNNVYKYLLTISVFDTGKVDIPSIWFYEKEKNKEKKEIIKDSLKTQFFSVFIQNSLTPEDSVLKDIKQPLPYYLKLHDYLFPVLLFLLLNIIYLFISSYIQNRKVTKDQTEEAYDTRPAWQIAMEMLELLRNQNLLDKKEWIEYHYQLSLVLRLFLDKQFNLKAVEMTTAEIKDSMDFYFSNRREILDLLSFCDMIKFAKYVPPVQKSLEYEIWLEKYLLSFKITEKIETENSEVQS